MNRAQNESDRFHREYYAKHGLFEAGTWLEKPNQQVMEVGALLAERESIRALDLGAGVGRNAIPLVKLLGTSKASCDCVEILAEAIDILRQNAEAHSVAEGITPIHASASDYHIAPNTYDLVMAMSVLEHAYDEDDLHEGIRMIQAGTRRNGFNCLSIATDLSETDVASQQALEPIIRTHISADRCRTMLSDLYADWDIQKFGVSPFKDSLLRDGRRIEWAAHYCLFVARKAR